MAELGNQPIPDKCDVLVIGGGPAGSSAATHLAKEGVDVVLLEKANHPRPQVGESLIPHFWKFTDLTGVSKKIENEGFLVKAGGISAWDDRIHQISFARFGYQRPALHVERDVFDDILWRHVAEFGANAFDQVSVRRVDFLDENKPLVHYDDKRGGASQKGNIRCRYLVDASGHQTILASHFNSRKQVCSKQKFLALWGYFENSRYFGADGKSYSPESLSSVKPVTFVSSYEDGWLWHIILRQKTSVGLIVHSDKTKGMGKTAQEKFFKHICATIPYLKELLEPATYMEGSLRFRPDYSYYSTNICGDNYYAIGDAAAFVDPIYSHGVQNSLYNAAVASVAIKASLKDESRRARFSKLCESRIKQFYSYSRSLALGDFGGDGVDTVLVSNLMKSMSPLELELMLAASEITNRSENFRKIARMAGVLGEFGEGYELNKARELDALYP